MAHSKPLLLGIALGIVLTGCTSTPPPVDVRVQCLPMRGWTADELKGFDAEYKGLQDGKHPRTLLAIAEYLQMRDADRACMNKVQSPTWGQTNFQKGN